MKRKNTGKRENSSVKEKPESGIIVVASGDEAGIYRFVSSAQRKTILKMNAENRCKEFRTDEFAKAEEYLQRALAEAEARKFPLGYIAVRSGQFKGVYPYISQEERLKHMNRYHKYEIRDFAHFHFRCMAEEWTEGRQEEHSKPRTEYHEVLGIIYETGNPERFTGIIKEINHGNLVFDTLECRNGTEHNVWIFHPEDVSDFSEGQKVSFTADVYEYIRDDGFLDYGIYREFDFEGEYDEH